MRLYPTVAVEGKSFKGVKKHVVPQQSMTLKEIIRRFIKREALPISREGVYEDRYEYDLEKLANEDFTVKEEVLSEFRTRAKELEKRMKKEDNERQDAMKKATAQKRKELFEELKAEYTGKPNPQTANEPKA